jgi:DNA-directed RNA polymerase alpha subunit
MRRLALIVAIVGLVLLMACQSGSTMGGHKRCSSQQRLGEGSGTCEGGWKTLSGITTLEIENDDIWSTDQIPVNMQITVESGSLQVSCKQPGDERLKVQVRPGETAVLAGVCEADSEEFDITFEALDGEATGVAFAIEYEVP